MSEPISAPREWSVFSERTGVRIHCENEQQARATASQMTGKLQWRTAWTDDDSGIPERRLMIMQGAPGSGKSTKAREIIRGVPSSIIFATDDYWYANPDVYAFDADKLGQAHRWNEARVHDAMHHGVELIVVDNTNVLRAYVLPYEALAMQHGYTLEYCRVDPGLDECLRRNALRPESRIIPESVVRELHAKMEVLGEEWVIEQPKTLST